jgi:CBS domain-containing protein
MLIRDILNLKGGTLYTVEPDAALADAVSLMVVRDIGSLVVVRNGAMAGLLTFREVLRALEGNGGTLSRVRVSDIMVADPVYGSPADTIDELREVMTHNHVRYLPVIDRGKLIGIVSFHDVAKAVIKETSMENRLLRRYIEQAPEIDAQA